jgi:hypothetical protein
MGGSALSSYYLLKEQKPGVNPLGPENSERKKAAFGIDTNGTVEYMNDAYA